MSLLGFRSSTKEGLGENVNVHPGVYFWEHDGCLKVSKVLSCEKRTTLLRRVSKDETRPIGRTYCKHFSSMSKHLQTCVFVFRPFQFHVKKHFLIELGKK